jgi:hypothetical protein
MEIPENAVMANKVINEHVRRRLRTDLSVPDKARRQLNAQQVAGIRNPNDTHR